MSASSDGTSDASILWRTVQQELDRGSLRPYRFSIDDFYQWTDSGLAQTMVSLGRKLSESEDQGPLTIEAKGNLEIVNAWCIGEIEYMIEKSKPFDTFVKPFLHGENDVFFNHSPELDNFDVFFHLVSFQHHLESALRPSRRHHNVSLELVARLEIIWEAADSMEDPPGDEIHQLLQFSKMWRQEQAIALCIDSHIPAKWADALLTSLRGVSIATLMEKFLTLMLNHHELHRQPFITTASHLRSLPGRLPACCEKIIEKMIMDSPLSDLMTQCAPAASSSSNMQEPDKCVGEPA